VAGAVQSGVAVNRAAKQPAELATRDFERILLVKPSSLGDVIHALPVLHGLRRRYPAAQIDWLVAGAFAPLIRSHPDLSDVVIFDRGRFGRLWRSPRVAGEFASFLGDLRRRRYDLVIDLQGLFRSAILTWATRSPVRIGFTEAREGAPAFYTHRIPRQPVDRHAVDRNWAVGEMLGFADDCVEFDLALPAGVQAEVDAMLRTADPAWDGRAPLVAVAPGARWDTKVWLPERFAEVIDALVERAGAHVVLLGSGGEAGLCDAIAAACRGRAASLAGRTSLLQMAAVIARANLVLCHDSAAVHLAVAVDRPALCITGPTNPSRTGPYRRAGDVVRLDLACSPCYLRRLSQCRHGHACMRDLPAAAVTARALAALEPASQSRPIGLPLSKGRE
jgi:lipopolysaccharide heptosyltransferase I